MNVLATACLKNSLDEVVVYLQEKLFIDEENFASYSLHPATWRDADPARRAGLLMRWLHAEALEQCPHRWFVNDENGERRCRICKEVR